VNVSEASVLEEICKIAARDLDVSREMRQSDRLRDDLGLDSLTMLTLAVALEDHFQVILSDETATRIETVGELARCISERAQART
jgi:acyl carrier protein